MDLFFIFCAKYLFVVPFLLAAIFFFRQERKVQVNIVVFGLCCALISYGVALLLGQLYFDPRPFVAGHFKPLIEHDAENGFPSDHVLLVAALSSVLTVFAGRLSILAWLCTFLIAVARVYVGVHHVIDVISSMLIAAIVTVILYLPFKRLWPKRFSPGKL